MKRWMIIGLTLLGWAILSNVSFAATYNATGIWSYTVLNNWVDQSASYCNPWDDVADIATITQEGDEVSFSTSSLVLIGRSDANHYRLTRSYNIDNGTFTMTFDLPSHPPHKVPGWSHGP